MTAESRLLEGSLDEISDDGWVTGWARFPGSPDEPVRLECVFEGEPVGTVMADQFRHDLAAANFENPNCAFWFKLPEAAFTQGMYLVSMRDSETSEELPNSPRQARLGLLLPTAAADDRNIIPNANFRAWPNGVSVLVKGKLTEFAKGWYVDFRKNTQPEMAVDICSPPDIGLKPSEYAVRISVLPGYEGYLRIIVPLEHKPAEVETFLFSCTLRRPVSGIGSNLGCSEIFLGSLHRTSLVKVKTLRKRVNPRGTLRLANLPVALDPKELAGAGDEASFAIVFDLSGSGELVLASPRLGTPARPRFDPDFRGRFEDGNINGQIEALKLSPIWLPTRQAVASLRAMAPPEAHRAVSTSVVSTGLPFVQIVIPVFNAADDVRELVASLQEHTTSPFEIILADDGSGPFTASQVDRWTSHDPRIRLLRHEENVGYTRNINLALQATVSDYVVLINSDTVVSPNWLGKLLEVMLEDATVGAVGPVSNAASWQSIPQTKSSDGKWVTNMLPPGMTVAEMSAHVERASSRGYPEFALLNGFCTLFRRSALDQVGYFDDEAFPKGYGEENDLCLRLRRAGWKLKVADETYVYHKKSKSFGTERRADLSKKANAILRTKHPEVRFGVLEDEMRASLPMNDLRHRLVERLGVELAFGGGTEDKEPAEPDTGRAAS